MEQTNDLSFTLGNIVAKLENIEKELVQLKSTSRLQQETTYQLELDLRNILLGRKIFFGLVFGLGAAVAWLIETLNYFVDLRRH